MRGITCPESWVKRWKPVNFKEELLVTLRSAVTRVVFIYYLK
jgi:hypothetical protein